MTDAAPRKPWLSPLNQRRWRNFRRNRRAWYSLIIFCVLFGLSLFAEFIANDKPIVLSYRGDLRFPVFEFYSERDYGGDFPTAARYQDIEVQCLILTGGLVECFDDAEGLAEQARAGTVDIEGFEQGWMLWPIIPYHHSTIVDVRGVAPSPPDANNWLGTDDTKRDVLARVIYGFRLSILFALLVTTIKATIGITLGALQGYFGGAVDLLTQRAIEVISSIPMIYVIIILFATLGRSFWLLVGIIVAFGWIGIAGLVRAEFLRARNFEYVRAARALGVSNSTIMFRHMLPNAMVSTVTFLPFIVTGAIGTLAGLDFLGYGLPSSAPSLGELSLQAKQNLQAPWLGWTAFFSFAIMLALMVYVFEGIRDAFDPRKTFA